MARDHAAFRERWQAAKFGKAIVDNTHDHAAFRQRWQAAKFGKSSIVDNKAVPSHGPGTELHDLYASLGVNMMAGCPCRSRIAQMNGWGVAGCREHRDEIIAWMREMAPKYGWRDKLAAAAAAIASGLAWKIDWLDPFAGIVDEAILRAEAKEAEAAATEQLK